MQVYIQKHNHGMYRDLLKYPPMDYRFLERPFCDRLVYQMSYPKIMALRFGIKEDDSLIHTHQALVKDKVPWVVDQSEAQLFIDSENYYKINKFIYTQSVEKYLNSQYCKKIMPTSKVARNDILNYYFINDQDKIEVVYPAIHKEHLKIEKRDKIKLLFVSGNRLTNYYVKGGAELFEAFKILNHKYDVFLTYIGIVPEEIKEKYAEYNNVDIKSPNYNQSQIFQIYKNHDIFLMPTYMDCFGYALLEAMSCELPIITTNMYAIPEIIGDNERGLLIDVKDICLHPFPTRWKNWNSYVEWIKKIDKTHIINELVEKTSLLIEDSGLLDKIRKSQRFEIERGKFSIEKRNEKLRYIYKEALE